MEKRYTALRVIGTFYKVLGGIVGILTLFLLLAVCLGSVLGGTAASGLGRELGRNFPLARLLGGAAGGLLAGLAVLLYGGGVAVTLYGMGELVYLLLALEENTRLTADLLRRAGGTHPPAP